MVTWEVVDREGRGRGSARPRLAANTSAVNQLLLALGRAGRSREVITAALSSVREAFGWSYGSYWEVDPEDQALRFVQDVGLGRATSSAA